MIKLYQENINITKDTDDDYIKAKIEKYPKLKEQLEKYLTNAKPKKESK